MPNPGNEPPLILTALLGQDAFAILDGLRRRHFPEQLNKVPAHISLFHHLPGGEVDRIVAAVTERCRRRRPLDLAPRGLRFLGRGVAIMYEAQDLLSLHAELSLEWAPWLTPQDRQPFKPHVTIQNKVAADEARTLFEAMETALLPTCRVEGVAIWRYLGGPWQAVTICPFGA